MAGRELLIAAALAVAPGVAPACSPVPLEPMAAPAEGPGCTALWNVDAYRGLILSAATDTGTGLIVQSVADGNACYWTAGLLIHDCAAGAAVYLPGERHALMDETARPGVQDAVVELVGTRPSTLEQVAQRARARGFEVRTDLAAGELAFEGGYVLPTVCACATHAPEAGPTSDEGAED